VLVLGLDFETTGVDAKVDRITEIGAVLWDTDTGKPIDLINQLVDCENRPEISKKITELTGITEAMLKQHGISEEQAFSLIWPWVKTSNFIVAHNAAFDKRFLESAVERNSWEYDTPWICTLRDVPYPAHFKSKALNNLAMEHEFLNPFKHRAVFDVLTMLKVLSNYNIEEVIQISSEKRYKVRAMVPFGRKDLAKERGYQWDSGDKTWTQELRESQLTKEIQDAPFQVTHTEVAANL